MSIGLIAILFGITAFLVVYAIFAPVNELPENSFDVHTDGLSQVVVVGATGSGGLFERIVRPAVRNFLPQTPMSALIKARKNSRTIELLARSGNPWNIQPEEFFGVRIFGAAAGFFVALLLSLVMETPAPPLVMIVVGGFVGYMWPRMVLDRHKARRAKDARKGLPEALDMLVITLNSGQTFPEALRQVVTRLPRGIVREELGRVSDSLRAGKNLSAALLDFARRAPSDEVEGFCRAVIMGEKLGADITETLRAQSHAARAAYEASLDVRIAKLPTTQFLPIILLMMPALFLTMLGPAFSNISNAL